jgi:hypothetical protein
MATPTGIRAGRAFVELFTDNTKLIGGLRAAEAKVKAFGASIRNIGMSMAGLGLAIAAPLAMAVKKFANTGDALQELTQRTKLTSAAAQELSYAASLSDIEVSALEVSLKRMNKTLYDAETGGAAGTEALNELGVSIQDLIGLSPEDKFKLLGDAISRIEDPTKQAAMAMAFFGKSGTDMLPMFENGAAGVEALQKKFRDLGITLSDEDLEAASRFADTLDTLVEVVKFSAISIGGALVPALQGMADTLIKVAKTVSQWIKDNSGLVVSIAKLVAGITAFGIALTILGTIVGAAGTIIGAFASVLGLLFTPIGMAVIAIVAIGAAVLQSGAAVQWLGGTFDTLKNDALTAFQGIADALAAGNISQAAKILWLTLKLEWVRGVTFVKNLWSEFIGFMTKAIMDVATAIVATPLIAVYLLENALMAVAQTFLKGWMGAIDMVAKGLIKLRSLFDFNFDAADAKGYNDQMASIDQDAVARNAEMDAAKQAMTEKQKKGLDVFGQWNQQNRGNIDDITSGQIAEHERALAAAQSEWSGAIAEARDMKSNMRTPEGYTAGDTPTNRTPIMPGIELPDIGEMIKQEAIKIGTRGTFSAFAAFGLGVGSSVEDLTAKAAEKTAENTRKMLAELKKMNNNDAMEFA